MTVYQHFIDYQLCSMSVVSKLQLCWLMSLPVTALCNPIIGVMLLYEIAYILFSLSHIASLRDLARRNTLLECIFRPLREKCFSMKSHMIYWMSSLVVLMLRKILPLFKALFVVIIVWNYDIWKGKQFLKNHPLVIILKVLPVLEFSVFKSFNLEI